MNNIRLLSYVIMLQFLGAACVETSPSKGTYLPDQDIAAAVGRSTEAEQSKRVKHLSAQELSRREARLREAEEAYNLNPENETAIIWYGRRLSYLGRYEDAIRVYSDGIKRYPESYQLYRHRGHRFITLRDLDQAVEDLKKAAFYVRDEPLVIEPDGIPNAINRPLSNNKFNIFYHLGLAYYLKGNYDKAISAYKKCLEFSNNPDLKVATTYWLYATYRKIGNLDAALAAIEEIPSRMNLIENRSYHDLIMMYRGLISPDILMMRNNESELDAAIAYGIGNYYQFEGRILEAQTIFSRLLATNQWDAFGYIAAEIDIKKIGL